MKVNSHSVTGNSLESRVKCVCPKMCQKIAIMQTSREKENH